ncbi:hypothetical protein GCM10022243_47580 [Saccharothrix violaceirubra]|uniref:Uncharacterized protein n=1 Tax=Saccharothrix violaceirubra TaxID=413306 RepID=A0A7W7WYA4_9PSEU|nr:hypothetical protein [Saccharothrix violaceirubra]
MSRPETDGSEQYGWVYTEHGSVVLSVPGQRELRFSPDDARVVGELLIKNASDADQRITSEDD